MGINPGIGEALSTRLASAARMVRRRGLNRVMIGDSAVKAIIAGALIALATTSAGAVPTRTIGPFDGVGMHEFCQRAIRSGWAMSQDSGISRLILRRVCRGHLPQDVDRP
jgi:hypothetical protein